MPHPAAGLQPVRVAGLEVPIAHPVVEQDAGVARHDTGTEAAVDALHAGNGIALAIGGAEIGRVAGGEGHRAGRRRAPQVDAPGELRGIVGGQQLCERRFDRMRVGAPALAVGEGELLRLDHDMHRVGRQEAHARKIEMLEDFQLLEQHEAGRVGRRLEHGEAAIVDPIGSCRSASKVARSRAETKVPALSNAAVRRRAKRPR